jgi:hypothetical protein
MLAIPIALSSFSLKVDTEESCRFISGKDKAFRPGDKNCRDVCPAGQLCDRRKRILGLQLSTIKDKIFEQSS